MRSVIRLSPRRGLTRALVAGLLATGALAGSAHAADWTALVPDVSNSGCQVTPVDLGTNTAGSPITTGGCAALGVAITPDARKGYVVEALSDKLTPIDLATNTAETPINLPAGSAPLWIAISPDGSTAYVPDFANHQVLPINLSSSTVGTPIQVGNHPRGIAFTPDGTKAYVSNYGDGTVTPINRRHRPTRDSHHGRRRHPP